MNFNEQQLQFINAKTDGAYCVVAGAGSGKTTCLIARILKLVKDGIKQEDIMTITFTNNSAKDLRVKLAERGLDCVRVGTFHAICRRILTCEGIDTSKQLPQYEVENCFRKISKDMNYDEIMSYISYQKTNNIGIYDDYKGEPESHTREEMREFYKAYEELKNNKKILDFSDWLLKAIEILENKPNTYTIKYLLVDEQQDNDILQNKLMKLLCPSGNVTAIGDVRQSIYSFKGGSPQLFMDFDRNYDNATIINLDMNYRSSKNIVENANKFIRNYLGGFRYYSDSVAFNESNGEIKRISCIDTEEEAIKTVDRIEKSLNSGVSPSEIAVLYRLNKQSFYVENELKLREIPYHIESDNNFFNRKEVKVILCVLRLIVDINDDSAYETIYNTRCGAFNFLSKRLLSDIEDLAARDNISLYQASKYVRTEKTWQRKNLDSFINSVKDLIIQHQQDVDLTTIINNIIRVLKLRTFIEEKYTGDALDERLESLTALKSFVKGNTLESFLKFTYNTNKKTKKKADNEIALMSVHKSKGLEWDNVYLIGVADGEFPSKRSDDTGEEARLFYVATTRPKRNLYISEIGFGNKFTDEYFEQN